MEYYLWWASSQVYVKASAYYATVPRTIIRCSPLPQISMQYHWKANFAQRSIILEAFFLMVWRYQLHQSNSDKVRHQENLLHNLTQDYAISLRKTYSIVIIRMITSKSLLYSIMIYAL